MEMKQLNNQAFKNITSQIQHSYEKFFALDHHELVAQHQMPTRQINLFVQQSYEKHLKITVQFNQRVKGHPLAEMTGFLRQHPNTQQYILTDPRSNLFRIIQLKDIRHLKMV